MLRCGLSPNVRDWAAEFWTAVDDVLAQIEANPMRFGRSEFADESLDFRFAVVRRFH
jgi:hypothetical protein